MTEIQKKLRDVRKNRNLTRIDAELQTGLSEKTIANWECGYCSPSLWRMEEYLKILGYKVDIVPIEE